MKSCFDTLCESLCHKQQEDGHLHLQNMVLLLNYSKSKVEKANYKVANCSKRKKMEANRKKNIVISSKKKVVEANCNKTVWYKVVWVLTAAASHNFLKLYRCREKCFSFHLSYSFYLLSAAAVKKVHLPLRVVPLGRWWSPSAAKKMVNSNKRKVAKANCSKKVTNCSMRKVVETSATYILEVKCVQ